MYFRILNALPYSATLLAMTPKEAISEMLRSGHTEKAIAQHVTRFGVPCHQSTISRIKTGDVTRFSFDLGSAILRAHWELYENAE